MDPIDELASLTSTSRRRTPRRQRFWTRGKVKLVALVFIMLIIAANIGLAVCWFYLDEVREFLGVEPRIIAID